MRRLVQLDDTPHNIALGVALGTIVAYQPIVGIQMVVGALVCRLFGANVLASVPMAWITNPLTIVPVYYCTYKVGVLFTGGEKTYDDIKGTFSAIGELGFWRGIVEGYYLLLDLLWPMVVGGALVGVANAGLFYILVLRYLKRRRARG